eukprot:9095057-Pyramimonas_sp.AAC.1
MAASRHRSCSVARGSAGGQPRHQEYPRGCRSIGNSRSACFRRSTIRIVSANSHTIPMHVPLLPSIMAGALA